MTFEPSSPFVSVSAPPARRERRRANELLFLRQGERRFVLKSYVEPDDAPGDAEHRVRCELAGVEAFGRAGTAALAPIFGPAPELTIEVDGSRRTFAQALVFPYVELPTLYDAIAATRDPSGLLREAGARIRARHHMATEPAAIHSDGSAHNVFSDFTWFDFCDPHVGAEMRDCKAIELLRFVSSVVEVSPAGTARPRVAAFCEAYADRDILTVALDFGRMDEPHLQVRKWTRMLGRPDKLLAFLRGDTRMFRRVRTWDALDRALR
jgi:hypothetical protein